MGVLYVELSWSTFILEVINFIVLVFILKHFFYKPVLTAIARRRESIDKTMEDARVLQQEAQQLKSQYEGRLSEWQEERQEAIDKLHTEMNEDRKNNMEKILQDIETEKQRNKVLDERRIAEQNRRAEEMAILQAAKFASKLLERLSGADVESRLFDLLIEYLEKLPEKQQQTLRETLSNAMGPARILSAYPLSETQKKRLEEEILKLIPRRIEFEYLMDKSLMAGLRITITPWVMHANLQDELKSLVDFVHESE